MPASSDGTSVNFGPVAQPPQMPALQPRTRNWYAVPVVLPICRNRRVLVADVSASVTGWNAPMLAVLLPVAICSSEVPPPSVHRKSTGSLLLPSGENSWIGSLNTAARLWTGAVETGPAAAGVGPGSGRGSAGGVGGVFAKDRVGRRGAAGGGVEATATATLARRTTGEPLA